MPRAHHPLTTASQLGAMLQAARKAKGLTQAALAGQLGVSQSRVSHLELHPQDLNVAQLLAWCATLDLELALGARDGGASAGVQADW